ncbi:MAG TPA: PTS sugar transporter subunit IIB [Clostridiaceae bacterium]|jgi:PTS system cellobiose-specific IIB component|nr:PTS sugar transporter subunit IIB [Clostridiaceae bacterium]HBF77903.1 PTS sugar transporter subunit IIB [Clostridiaceae bacterium]HBG38392.1 PTS sugar transporter subunit IIB [Clostridiaceae bacterium]HBN28158.1 PTS sugar transporter subunit IIB [Clostridiaceae bacterium]HBX49212.1 PTS sugar transporter subunit IIB [Clostridiaceae bacterium]
MAKKTIMLVCTHGMSTSILVKKMREAAAKEGIDAEIFAEPMSNADLSLETKDIDVILLGPQIKYAKEQFGEKVKGKKTKVAVINMDDYGLMRGDVILKKALEL